MKRERLLHLESLSVSYRTGGALATALSGISLEMRAGERLALIGESGSGKSTLALAVAGLLPATASVSGRVAFPGFPDAPRLGRDIGVVFQDPSGSLDPLMRVGDQIAEILVAHTPAGWAAARRDAVRLLDRVRIPRAALRARDYPHQFSGGQQQRIAIAAAIAAGPGLLVADEPTSALDTVVQREIIALFDELQRDTGTALLLVTHDIALASGIAGRIAVLFRGQMAEWGPTARVLAAPEHPHTQALLRNRLDLHSPFRRPQPEIGSKERAALPAHLP